MRHFQQKRTGRDIKAYEHGGIEPSLDEVLRDPIVHLVMARDRVQPEELLRLIACVRRGRAAATKRDGRERRLCA